VATFAGMACASAPRVTPPSPVVVEADTIAIPLDELGARKYRGVQGGLYPGGVNVPPADHAAVGIARRNLIRPLDVNGYPNGAGRYVLMSVGAGNASAVWCSRSSAPPCGSWSLTGRAVSDPSVNHGPLVIVNGAIPGGEADLWSNPSAANYNRIRDTRLAPLGLSEKQVQIIWMNIQDTAAAFPAVASPADAAPRLQRMGAIIRALKKRYPNLQLLFVASRPYLGYSANGEPAAYESGFVVKWAIESQMAQELGRLPNPDAGDLSESSGLAPWVAWGPYFWSRGPAPRTDGVAWLQSDFDGGGSLLSLSGESKIASLLFDFFKSSPFTRCWFLAGPACG
jgi:hypothetical protein